MESKDFDKCKYDLHNMDKGQTCVDRYADLGVYRDVFEKNDLPQGLDSDFVLKFLILTYTHSSPFVKTYISDLATRKSKVLEYLGINSQDKITPEISNMATLKCVAVAARWIMFLRIQSNEKWTYLVTCQERFIRQIESFTASSEDELSKVEPKVELDISKNLNLLKDQIKSALSDFMEGEKARINEEFINFTITSESFSIMPEQYIPIWAKTQKLPYALSKTGL